MLLLYYNPTNRNYYLRYYKRTLNGYRVGYKNQFGHTVVKILIIQNGDLVDVKDVDAWRLDEYKHRDNRPSLKVRLKNRVIGFLIKL